MRSIFIVMLLLATGVSTQAQELTVVSVSPPAHSTTAAPEGAIEVHLDRAVERASVDRDSFWAFNKGSGPVEGSIEFDNGDQTIRLVPDQPMAAGQIVTVFLSHDLNGADGAPMRSKGYSFQFWIRSVPGDLQFSQAQVISVGDERTQAYGGIATDLNEDGFLDMLIVNEVSADVRVFLNSANFDVQFEPMLPTTFGVGTQASPSEPSDFNRDGHVDICVANIATASVSVLAGNGDGTFQPQQLLPVGSQPRGIAVLDADGDGDVDIACTNSGSSNVSILLNDGMGNFLVMPAFEAGGDGEWALASADMDDDGALDLVVGARNSGTIIVNRGNGDGTFTPGTPQSSGGSVWMLVCGDVNGDGREDVACANSISNNGAILLGSPGGLVAPQTFVTDPFPLATDLGDMDGDGDLDWVTSSFSGNWFLFENDASGNFKFKQQFASPRAASCSLAFDADNDGDLDLALIDEVADAVLVQENMGFSTTVERLDWTGLRKLFGGEDR